MTKILKVENLFKKFQEEQVAVNDLSFTVSKGEIMALLGPNGSGKTSTIKMVCGLLLPTSGSIEFLGKDMALASNRSQTANQISAVLEGARNIYWRMTPIQNLYYFGLLRGLSRNYIKQKANDLLDELGLGDKKDTPVNKFSRGMQQKVALAVALLPNPSLLLLDEPTLGLDIESANIITKKIARLAKENELGVILTSHSMNLIEALANNVLIIRQGSMVAYESIEDLKKNFNSNHIIEIVVEGDTVQSSAIDVTLQDLNLVVANQNTVHWINPDQARLTEVIDFFIQQNYKISSIENRQPTLEEIFLHHTS